MLRGSESNLWGSKLEANYASSCEEILSSKDSLNFISSVKRSFEIANESQQHNNTGCLTKPPPDSPGPRQRPRR
ncbi:hypothetical protein DAPPUDRAFT_321530 [Daphnia pulex]|uniref:Uncharacterized protein n=1 Tax=Daphnia pulex TaxID=6669 RepID=E9GSY0_DAPPU|nr:hypothetical protein DAPPUDRAFT_321530 [Daphnia pulex]|eukprot:EFX77364.1 hypothetical protein DAPPUDRAFT_321530 [Daphnia pulex]